MADQTELVARSDRIVGRLLAELGPAFSFSPVEPHLGVMFGFRERAPKGQFWADGQRDRLHLSPTPSQWVTILNTSPNDDVGKERLRLFMLERIDTSMPAPTPTAANIDALVAEKVAAAMARHFKDVADGTARHDILAREVVKEIADEVGPVGLQTGTRHETKPMPTDQARETGLWLVRGEKLFMAKPRINKDGSIDGRWLRRAKSAWQRREASSV